MRENIYLKKYHSKDPVKYPRFVYCPDPVTTGAFWEEDPPAVCECCGEKTELTYCIPFYSEIHDLDGICPACLASGRPALEKDGEYTLVKETERIDDPEKTELLIRHTPGIPCYWRVIWRSHCNDYCAYLGQMGYQQLKEEGLIEELLNDPMTDSVWNEQTVTKLEQGGWWEAHVFECITCGKHLFCIEEDYEGRFE